MMVPEQMFDMGAVKMTEARNSDIRQALLHAQNLLTRGRPLLMVGENGSGKEYLARILHQRAFGSQRELIRIDRSEQGKIPNIIQGSTFLLIRLDTAGTELQAEWVRRSVEAGAAIIATSDGGAVSGFDPENQVRIPALRERRDDIELLTCDFLSTLSGEGSTPPLLTAEAISAFLLYEWPGNLDELFGVLSSAARKAGGKSIDLVHLPPEVAESLQPAPPKGLFKRYVRSAELLLIRWALRSCGDDRTKAARFLGLSRAALYKKLKLYPEFRVTET